MIVRLTALHRAVHEGEELGALADHLPDALAVGALGVERQAVGLEGLGDEHVTTERERDDSAALTWKDSVP